MGDTVYEKDARKIRTALDSFRGFGNAVHSWNRDEIVVDSRLRRLYSYGTHFPLVEYVPRGRGRKRDLFVLNGDTWFGSGRGWHRSRTGSHQESVRQYVATCSDADSLILPFSAIDGSGIEVSSIRPIEVRDDARWTELHPLPADAPDMDDLASADTFKETDDRSTVDWQGNPLPDGHFRGTWHRDYVWKRANATYSRTIYRASSVWSGPDANARTWTLAPSWDEPTSDSRYLNGFSLELDTDGSWKSESHEHRLGDALFSAIRPINEPTRAARPFETSKSDARGSVQLRAMPAGESPGSVLCEQAEDRNHVAGPGTGATTGPESMPACIYCGLPLVAQGIWRRRATYLSSFDYQEWPPLYFLAEVPPAARPKTVDEAIEALAPPAVHAAYARGRDVLRQGDIFFIGTELVREDLIERGATFARFSLITHSAQPRRLEPHYRPGPTAADIRKEKRYARRLWRESFRSAAARATSGDIASARPKSEKGTRAKWRKIRADHARDVAFQRAKLRRLTLRGPRFGDREPYRMHNETSAEASRRSWLTELKQTRETLDALMAAGARDHVGHLHARHARDEYRHRYGTNASGLWARAELDARDRYRPALNQGEQYRAAVRRALAIYGTAHSATEVATCRDGTTYARGIARHVPELDPDRRGGRDHRHLDLGDRETWYLAVRNTVPRQASRRRNRRRTVPAR